MVVLDLGFTVAGRAEETDGRWGMILGIPWNSPAPGQGQSTHEPVTLEVLNRLSESIRDLGACETVMLDFDFPVTGRAAEWTVDGV